MIDVAVAIPVFADLTFLGLEAIPRPGQEFHARELRRSPGGGAITAIGCARLGLDTLLASPTGADDAGAAIRDLLDGEGVRIVAPHDGATAMTVILPGDGDRAMVTFDPGARARTEDLHEPAARAIVCGIDRLGEVPDGARVYVSLGDEEARRYARGLPDELARADALVVNEAEAAMLTGGLPAAEAAARLAEVAASAIVTRGPRGAVGVIDGREVTADGVDAGPPVDTTGAGDLFIAALVWSELRGAEPQDRLAWAALYSALSVTRPTGVEGAATASRLIEEGTRRGLARHPVPAGHALPASPGKEQYP